MMSSDTDAVKIANERLWMAHPELSRRKLTMDPKDTALRKEWVHYHKEAKSTVSPPPTVTPSPYPLPPAVPIGAIEKCPTSKEKDSGKREIKSITIKRKNIDLFGDDKYGHWWFEIDKKESYGWWPKGGVGLKETLGGTDGELNGQSNFGGSATKDPHHGDKAEEDFHPVVSCDDKRTDAQIKQCLRKFAKSYSGEWRWTFGGGQNCHTFQEAALKHCKLEEP